MSASVAVSPRLAALIRARRPPRDVAAEVLAGLHPRQRAFVVDASKRKAACCSRRAGKTHAVAVDFLLHALSAPGLKSLFIARSAAFARELLWDGAMRDIARDAGIDARIFAPDQTFIRFANGHKIWLAGCNDRGQLDAFRGPAYSKIGVDEAQAIPSVLGELLDDVLEPAAGDHDATITVTGTPGLIPAGPFHAITTGREWSVHHWTLLDNSEFPRWRGAPNWTEQAAEYYRQQRARKRWEESHPTYQREWLGRWVEDVENRVVPYDATINAWTPPLPEGQTHTVLGVDLATSGTSAFVIASTVLGWPETFVRHVSTLEDASMQRVLVTAERLREEWGVHRTIVDAGGLGRAYIEELRRRYGAPVEPAEKRDKAGHAYTLAGEMQSGQVRVHASECGPLLDEAAQLVWDDDRQGWSDDQPDHCVDAMLYAWRALRPTYRPEREAPPRGTTEWGREQAAKHKARAEREVRRRLRRQRGSR